MRLRQSQKRTEPEPNSTEQGPESKPSPWWRLLSFLVVSLGGCLILGLVAAAFLSSGSPVRQTAAEPARPSPSLHPTLEIPAAPAPVNSESLRAELLGLADQLLADFPQLPEALHVTALLFADLQQTTRAKELWQTCLSLAPQEIGPYVGMARAMMSLGEDEAALATLRRATAAGLSSPEIDEVLGTVLTKLGQLDDAEAAYLNRLRVLSHDADTWLKLGQLQLQLKKFDQAVTSLERSIAEGNPSETALLGLATAFARQDKTEEAARYRELFAQRKSAQEAEGKVEFQTRYDEEMRRIGVSTFARIGAVYDHQGRSQQAEQQLLRALALSPSNPVVLGELGGCCRRRGRIADARLIQRRLVEVQPEVLAHYVNLASLSAELNDHETAEAVLMQVIRMRPELSIGYTGLAQVCWKTGRFADARKFAEMSLRQEPSNRQEVITMYLLLAAACEKLNDPAGAESAYAKARQLVDANQEVARSGDRSTSKNHGLGESSG